MPIDAWELAGDELSAEGDNPSGTTKWLVTGTSDPLEALTAVANASPIRYQGLWRGSIKPHFRGGGVWETTVEYQVPTDGDPTEPAQDPDPENSQESSEPGENDALGPEFSVSITAGTQKVTQSLRTRFSTYVPGIPGTPPPNMNGAIGVTKDGEVEGTEKVVPKVEFVYARHFSKLTLAYIAALRGAVGCTNKDPENKKPGDTGKFFGHEPGELLFLGAEIQKFVPGKGWPITFKFAAGKNMSITFGSGAASATVPVKAWEHVWVMYKQVESGGRTVSVPDAVYVEQIYEEVEFRKTLLI